MGKENTFYDFCLVLACFTWYIGNPLVGRVVFPSEGFPFYNMLLPMFIQSNAISRSGESFILT
jgi:hypothetical protein